MAALGYGKRWRRSAPPAPLGNLQSLIDACPAGGTVSVPAGTYAAVVIPRPMSVVFAPGAVVSGGSYCIWSKADDVTLRNPQVRDAVYFGIYGNGVSRQKVLGGRADNCGDFGVHFQADTLGPATDVLIEDFIAKGFRSAHYPGHGVYVKRISGVLVRRVDCSGVAHLVGNGDSGLQLSYCENARVEDSYCHDNAGYGFISQGWSATAFVRSRGQYNGQADFYQYHDPDATYEGCTGTRKVYP